MKVITRNEQLKLSSGTSGLCQQLNGYFVQAEDCYHSENLSPSSLHLISLQSHNIELNNKHPASVADLEEQRSPPRGFVLGSLLKLKPIIVLIGV